MSTGEMMLTTRTDAAVVFGAITGAAFNDWHHHGAPFWQTFGTWSATLFVAWCCLLVLWRVQAWRDRWLARRAAR